MGQSVKNFFSSEQQKSIRLAINNAELDTSGEILVHIETKCPGDVLDRAAKIFDKLHLQKTKQRNAVLFYLSIENRKFAVLGDAGINARVAENFWDDIKNGMIRQFREGRFAEGLAEAIEHAGQQLKQHFPYQKDDVNELPDDISFGKTQNQ